MGGFLNKCFSKGRGDLVLWLVTALLLSISLVAVYSSMSGLAVLKHKGISFYLIDHFKYIILAAVAMFVFHYGTSYLWHRLSRVSYIIAIIMLLYVLFCGQNINNAYRTFSILGFSFQSSEFAKVALVLYISNSLIKYRDKLDDKATLWVHFFLPTLLIVGLIFTENFSTAVLLLLVCMLMFFIGKIPFKELGIFILILGVLGGCFVGYKMLKKSSSEKIETAVGSDRSSVWGNRIGRFFTPDEEIENPESDQVIQGKIAIASGGLFGKLPGKSTQRNVLPEAFNDFIFAIILEETGIFGLLLIVLYFTMFFRALVVMKKRPGSFGGFLAVGLALLIVVQAVSNMSVVVGLVPATGQPLPLVSRGGSSLLMNGIVLGIIISLTKENKENGTETEPEKDNY